MAQQLSELEMTEQMMSEADALANMAEEESQSLGEGMCKGGNNPGQGMQGNQQGNQQGNMAGRQRGMQGGRAQGGNTGKAKTPTATKSQKAQSKNAGGDVIARQLIENPNPEVGASVVPSESIGEAVDGGSGASVGEDQVPTHLKETHKHYFGTLKKRVAQPSAAPTTAPTGGSK